MTTPSRQHAFVAGEVSPETYGREDIERFAFGLKTCRNFWVDYRGGVTFRPGTEFINFAQEDDQYIRFIPFRFSLAGGDSYVLVFGDEYLRFIQAGGYVLETGKAISALTSASPGVATSASHGFTNGDWVQITGIVGPTSLNGKLFQVGATTTNTFQLQDTFGDPVDTSILDAYVSGGTAARVYTLSTPYAAEDLDLLHYDQDKNTLVLTRQGYDTRILTRTDHVDWTLSVESFSSGVTAPSRPTLTPSTSGSAGVVFGVTSVDAQGVESAISPLALTAVSVDYSVTAGSMKVTWPAVSGAKLYRVYRSIVNPTGVDMTLGEDMGFVGRAFGPQFTDPNIQPDFSLTPPQHFNPFADAFISEITITAGGTGYAVTDSVVVTDGAGTGFQGYPIVNGSGAITAVVITNAGSGYTSPTVSFTTSGGSGATATAAVGPTEGNEPATTAFFQQRRVYASTQNLPRTLFGSRPGAPSNMDVSVELNSGDAYVFELDSRLLSPIRHLVRGPDSLLAFTETDIFQLKGFDNQAITPLSAQADEQFAQGATATIPLKIGETILYIAEQGVTVQGMTYNKTLRGFQTTDLGIMSNHLFSAETQIDRWAYLGEPAKVALCVSRHGRLNAFTFIESENVRGWAPCTTRGLFEDIVVVSEGRQDTAYVLVKRFLNGRYTKTIERFKGRLRPSHAEEAWHLDCALELAHTYPAASLTCSAASGAVTLTASGAVFSAGNVGDVVRVNGGIVDITAFVSSTVVTGTVRQTMTGVLPEDDDNTPLVAESGDWSMDTPVTSATGLDHLLGETVSIIVDGNVKASQIVTLDEDGFAGVSWTGAGTQVIIGLKYTGILETLPVTFPDAEVGHRRKRILASSVRVSSTRGLKVGPSRSVLYSMKDRTTENYNEPTRLRNDVPYSVIDSAFNDDGSIVITQEAPLPATVLGIVRHVEVGDDNN